MTRSAYFNSPFLLGFEHLDRLLERTAKAAGDGYPPYNIEQSDDESLRITLAVAGFSSDELSVTVEDRQLVIKGKQNEAGDRTFLHRGKSRPGSSSAPLCWRKASTSRAPSCVTDF